MSRQPGHVFRHQIRPQRVGGRHKRCTSHHRWGWGKKRSARAAIK
jgi:hypothetical protein